MPTKKPLSGQALRRFRSDVAKLKRKGLTSPRVDARAQKPTRHMREKVAKFSGVISGRDKVVTASSRRQAKALGELFGGGPENNMSSGRAVAVPTGKGGRAYVVKGKGKKDDVVKVARTENGKRTVSEFVSGARDNLRGLPFGKRIKYRISFASGQTITYDTLKGLAEFMYDYENPADPKRKPWENWRRYIEIVRVKDDDDAGDD